METAKGDALLSAASRTGVLLTAEGASTEEKEDSMQVELMRRGLDSRCADALAMLMRCRLRTGRGLALRRTIRAGKKVCAAQG